MPQAVLDTNVLVASIRSRTGASYRLLLELAIACASTHLVTFNKRDFAGAERFGISVLTPAEFLAVLRR